MAATSLTQANARDNAIYGERRRIAEEFSKPEKIEAIVEAFTRAGVSVTPEQIQSVAPTLAELTTS